MTLRSALDGLRSGPWLRNGVWTLADQGLFAGANFLVNILLARWLSPEGFGAYTVAYTVFLLLGTLHAGVLVEPMLVYGASRFRDRLPQYLRLLVSGHARFAVGGAVVLGAGAVYFWTSGQLILGHALAAFAVGQAAILFQWLMRSACYVETRPFVAASSGLLYAGLMIAGVAGLQATGMLNEATGIGLMAGASLAAGLLMARRLGLPLRATADAALTGDAVRRHRAYGGWAASTGALEWYHGFLPFLLLPFVGGLEETGALRALFNLVLPVLHVFHALAHLLVPVFVRARAAGTDRRVALRVGAGLLVVTVVYAVAVELGGAALMHWLYDGKYDAYGGLMWTIAVLPLVLAVSNVCQALLRSQERPEAVFAARAAASGVASTLGAALVVLFGVAGALLAEVASALTETLTMAGLLRRGATAVPSVGTPHVASGEGAARRRVLIVAFACGPARGSEPGQGWEMARGLAARFDVTALVYAGFRRAVEAELAARPVPGLVVVFYRLPGERRRHHAEGVDRSGWREQIHYHLWQRGAARLAARLHEAHPFDAVQHTSLMRYWSPSAAVGVPDVPFVWGPVGGGESVPPRWTGVESVAVLGVRGALSARLRAGVRALSHGLPSVRRTARGATLALATTDESAARMRRLGAPTVQTVPASVALTPDEVERLGAVPSPPDGPLRLVTVGRLLPWKGYALALDAFADAAAAPAMAGATLTLVGDGPDRRRLERRVRRLGLAGRVRVTGLLPREAALDEIARAHVLVHPSLHDSGGYATLEGMAAGRPVVCLALGGPALQVTPETGFAVDAPTPAAARAGLASAFARLSADADLRRALGVAGRARVATRFTWPLLVTHVADALVAAMGGPAAVDRTHRPGRDEAASGDGAGRAGTAPALIVRPATDPRAEALAR